MRPKSGQTGSTLIVGIIFILLLLVVYTWGKYYWSSREDPRVVECRRNLLTIATALEIHQAVNSSFEVDSLESLKGLMEEPFDLTCPESDLPYSYYASPDSYLVTCPTGHGEVDAGRVPWRR